MNIINIIMYNTISAHTHTLHTHARTQQCAYITYSFLNIYNKIKYGVAERNHMYLRRKCRKKNKNKIRCYYKYIYIICVYIRVAFVSVVVCGASLKI